MKAKKMQIYKCPECGTPYIEEDDACDCCRAAIDSENGWQCGECDELYDNKEDAADCCK